MQSNPRRDEPNKIRLDEDLGPAAQNPSNVGNERRDTSDPDEIGIPSGYLERSFESKRSPLRRRLRSEKRT